MKVLLIAVLILAVSGCGLSGSNGKGAADGGKKGSGSADEETKRRIAGLKTERRSQPLPASEIQISGVGDSQTGSTTAGSTLETSEAARSEVEISRTLSELDATQTEQGIVINLPESILFDFDKADVKPEAEPTLKKVGELLAYYKDSPMQINGHTDSKGSDQYNRDLSERRAEAVKKALAEKFNADGSRLKAEGFGETKPVAPNAKPDGSDDPEGRQKNRRVEVVIENARQPQNR